MTTSSAALVRPPHPWVWAVLYFPYGLTFGFPAIALGYLGHRAGMPLSAIAGIVGVTFLAAGWKFLWAPLGDYTLSRKRWYVLALGMMVAGLVALTLVPLSAGTLPLVSLLVLFTSVSGTFLAFATEGLMVHNTPIAQRGRAAGWFQSGNQFGQTAGGGIALWLMSHVPAPWMAGAALAAIAGTCAIALRYVDEPVRALEHATVRARVADAWRSLAELLRSRLGRIGLLLAILPIGTGAAQFLFGSLGSEWSAPSDMVSLVLGAGGGLAIVTGCVAGGRLSDRVPRPVAYALACALSVLSAAIMSVAPHTALAFAATTLFYTFALGMVNASFTGLVLSIVGHSAAATKINLFFALNTLFSIGVLRLDGWTHDAWGTTQMLRIEAAVGVAALLLFSIVANRVRGESLGGDDARAPAPAR